MKPLSVILIVLFLVACSNEDDGEITLRSFRVNQQSIPREVFYDELDKSLIFFELTYSDNSVSQVSLDDLQLSDNQLERLYSPGFHTLSVNYENKTTYFSIELLDPCNIIIDDWIDTIGIIDSKHMTTINNDSYYVFYVQFEISQMYTAKVEVDDITYHAFEISDEYEVTRPVERFLRENDQVCSIETEGLIVGSGYQYSKGYFFTVEFAIDNHYYRTEILVDKEVHESYSNNTITFERSIWRE